jgi:hypothetical protein
MDQSLNQLTYLFDMAQQFDTNMKTTVAVVVAPSLISLGGALFLSPHLGLIQSFFWPQIGLMAGLISAMRPAIQNKVIPK